MLKISVPQLIGMITIAIGGGYLAGHHTSGAATSHPRETPHVATTPPLTTASPANALNMDTEFESRLMTTVAATVHTALGDWIAQAGMRVPMEQTATGQDTESNPPRDVATGFQSSQSSEDHQAVYDRLHMQLREAAVNHGLTWGQLTASAELRQLPPEWRDRIYGEVAAMLNNGELDPNHFLEQAQ